MSLFMLENVFDGTAVHLDTESEGPEGPFTVKLEFTDRSIGGEDETFEFVTLKEAVAKFNELCLSEIQAVLDDGSFA